MANESSGRTVMAQGRIVWTSGDLFQGKIKTQFGTNIPQLDQQGQQVKEYGFGLAIPKNALGEIWEAIHQEAYSVYPSRQVPPSFAWKYKDGDGIDDQGRPFAQREGYQGCLVFACTTRLPIKFFRFENGQNILINEGIKCGDYVNAQLQVKGHGAFGQGKPGLYVNPMAVQLLGYGTAIVNAPSGDQIFGTATPPMPQGASATPIAQPGMLVPPAAGMPQYQAPPTPAGAAPQYQQQPAYAGQPPAQPNYGVLPQQYQPQAAPQPQYPAAAPQAPGMPMPPGVPPYGGQ